MEQELAEEPIHNIDWMKNRQDYVVWTDKEMTTRLPIVRRHLEAVAYLMVLFVSDYIIIIRRMYVYCALINALSAHTIHIKLNTILYTHIERSPTKTIYIGYYMETHTHTHTHTHTNDHSRNWVLILVGMEIL